MDFEAAAKEAARRASLDTHIRRPGIWLDTQFSYWEKDHAAEIGSRQEKARAQKEAISLMAETIRELSADPKKLFLSRTGGEILAQARLDFARDFGKRALSEAEKVAGCAETGEG